MSASLSERHARLFTYVRQDHDARNVSLSLKRSNTTTKTSADQADQCLRLACASWDHPTPGGAGGSAAKTGRYHKFLRTIRP